MIDQTFGNVWIIEKEVGRAPHPASLADLVEVLKEQGAFEIDSRLTKRYWPVIQLEGHTEPGRYLVLPLGDTP